MRDLFSSHSEHLTENRPKRRVKSEKIETNKDVFSTNNGAASGNASKIQPVNFDDIEDNRGGSVQATQNQINIETKEN